MILFFSDHLQAREITESLNTIVWTVTMLLHKLTNLIFIYSIYWFLLIPNLSLPQVVSVSKTPGHTKHFQTIFLTPTVKLCDCPGLVFPSLVQKPLQVGLYLCLKFHVGLKCSFWVILFLFCLFWKGVLWFVWKEYNSTDKPWMMFVGNFFFGPQKVFWPKG